ncbi:hypothetical protein OC842_005880 [Tilletia horrida]|uniref:DUF431-domain-containing protein n=1 Tax=Tilletia horrida TaxID=155126 RepID=A0AAN6JI27_9BASI|nr:hypothetical protein OC842_005880 [Tilletia horrida]
MAASSTEPGSSAASLLGSGSGSAPARSRPARPEYFVEHMEEDDPDAPDVFPQWALLDTVHFTSLSRASIASLESQLASATSTTSAAAFQLHSDSVMTVAAARGVEKSQICLLDPKAPRALTFRDFRRSATDATASDGSSGEVDTVDGPFDWFLFGGILGDDPPRDRTASLRELGFPRRHLGGVQMTTDTALGVTKRVVEDDFRLNLPDSQADEGHASRAEGGNRVTQAFTWVDQPELKFGPGEAVEMPFRYMAEQPDSSAQASAGTDASTTAATLRPLMPPGMRALIRKDLDRCFEF